MTETRPWDPVVLRDLKRATIRDLLRALALPPRGSAARWAVRLAMPMIRRFTESVARFDADTARYGLAEAARRLLHEFEVDICCPDNMMDVPRSGPLLIISNHPGMTDTLVLLSLIERDDLLVIAERNPFLTALPNVSRQILYLETSERFRGSTLRRGIRSLRSGGALLLFPAGRIEPDPVYRPEAVRLRAGWSKSMDLLVRHARDAVFLPMVVGGVFSKRTRALPLQLFIQDAVRREQVLAMLQFIFKPLQKTIVHVETGGLFCAPGDATAGQSALPAVMESVDRALNRLIQTAK
ncbi:hypothetical protein GF324_05600 [bacterium]|nr:hypothetical protein [bacterium]